MLISYYRSKMASNQFTASKRQYNKNEKEESRRELFSHAVNSLTTDRSNSVCVKREQIHDICQLVFANRSSTDQEDLQEQFEGFCDSNFEHELLPSKLRVCYLCGPNPINDLKILVKLGVVDRNVWAVEKETKTLEAALQNIKNSNLRGVHVFHGDIGTFFKEHGEPFDIIYLDFCGSLPSASQNTLRTIGIVFLRRMLKSPGALITNFSFPPAMEDKAKESEESEGDNTTVEKQGNEKNSIEQRVKKLVEEITNIKQIVKEQDQEKTNIELRVNKPVEEKTNIEQRVEEIFKQITNIEQRVKEPGQEKTNIKQRVKEVAKEVTSIKRRLQEIKEKADIEHFSKKYLYYRLSNLKRGLTYDDWNEFCAEQIDSQSAEDNYSDYVTFQVIDSAYMYIPAYKMVLSGREKQSLWGQLFVKQEEFINEVENLECWDTCAWKKLSTKLVDCVCENSRLCKKWVNEIFPNWKTSSCKKFKLDLLIMTHGLSYIPQLIERFTNKNLKKMLEEGYQSREQVCGAHTPFKDALSSLVISLLYGQMTHPSFPVLSQCLCLKYTAEERQMFSDVVIFDRCRYLFDFCPNAVINLKEEWKVLCMLSTALRKAIVNVCGEVLWSSDIVAKTLIPSDLPQFISSLPDADIPKRRSVQTGKDVIIGRCKYFRHEKQDYMYCAY